MTALAAAPVQSAVAQGLPATTAMGAPVPVPLGNVVNVAPPPPEPVQPKRAARFCARCGVTVVMRRWMTGRKLSQIGTWRHNPFQTTRSTSASIGDSVKRRFRPLRGAAASAQTAWVKRASKPQARAILGLTCLNFLSA